MRTRRLAGLALLSLGLLLSVASYLMVDEALREAAVGVYSEPMWYLFWVPRTYTLVETPSYTLINLYVGAASLTAGCVLVFGDPLFREEGNKEPA
jgi:hypothetical protein